LHSLRLTYRAQVPRPTWPKPTHKQAEDHNSTQQELVKLLQQQEEQQVQQPEKPQEQCIATATPAQAAVVI